MGQGQKMLQVKEIFQKELHSLFDGTSGSSTNTSAIKHTVNYGPKSEPVERLDKTYVLQWLEEIGFGAHKKSKFDKCNIIQYMTSKRDI
jgi:hypothetical protein